MNRTFHRTAHVHIALDSWTLGVGTVRMGQTTMLDT